jgi:DNA-binding Xre family transcriptional regulator
MIQENITGKQLALMSGLSESEISDIKNGRKIPNQFTMIQICSALEKEMHEVFEIDYKNVKFM